MEENKTLNTEEELNVSDVDTALNGGESLSSALEDADTSELDTDTTVEDAELDTDAALEESEASEEKPEYVPKNKYEKALYGVYRDEGLAETLRVASYAIVAVTVYAFFVHCLNLLAESPLLLVEKLIITAVPFIAVSVMRYVINAPRPYELLEFYEKKPKSRTGCSFPSRHVFSVFVIATVMIPQNIALGIGLLVLGAVLGAMRVLLGLHFIRDVVAGALIGVISGVIGLLTLMLI